MPRGMTEKTSKKVAQITKILQSNEVWQNELAKQLKVSPQMMNYYLKKYFKGKLSILIKEGNNKKLKMIK